MTVSTTFPRLSPSGAFDSKVFSTFDFEGDTSGALPAILDTLVLPRNTGAYVILRVLAQRQNSAAPLEILEGDWVGLLVRDSAGTNNIAAANAFLVNFDPSGLAYPGLSVSPTLDGFLIVADGAAGSDVKWRGNGFVFQTSPALGT